MNKNNIIRNRLSLFCNRWENKYNEMPSERTVDVFDKFITRYIIFNSLYTYINDLSSPKITDQMISDEYSSYKKRNNNNKDFPDNIKATYLPAYFLKDGNDLIIKSLKSQIGKIEKIRNEDKFYINAQKYSGRINMIKLENDKKLYKQILESKENKEILQGLLRFVYLIRNNVFHGSKYFSGTQT